MYVTGAASLDYQRFRTLLQEGEKAHVDFKIRCDAFATPNIGVRGELAKDICAMANNGNRASFIIIGVSDDATCFRSVDNNKLTDDNLQDFCKKALYPPPTVRLHWRNWKHALPAHRDKDFVVIQIGPNKRQAFRLAQDFVEYSQKACYRRNEVWIRRNATSDLATPEEIVRLASASLD
jgi:predicted HTH transcriptional regulator